MRSIPAQRAPYNGLKAQYSAQQAQAHAEPDLTLVRMKLPARTDHLCHRASPIETSLAWLGREQTQVVASTKCCGHPEVYGAGPRDSRRPSRNPTTDHLNAVSQALGRSANPDGNAHRRREDRLGREAVALLQFPPGHDTPMLLFAPPHMLHDIRAHQKAGCNPGC